MSIGLWDSSPPATQRDFEIAIICALTLEADAVTTLFDRRWDSKIYRKAPGDTNSYSTGAIGHHNVVLVHLPNMGKVAAATAAAFLRTSYEGIKLALVVGICGGIPSGRSLRGEMVLGDVVISNEIIQYDFGRQFPYGFVRKTDVQDSLPRPPPAVRTFLAMLQTTHTRDLLQKQTLEYLDVLQQKLGNMAKYPGSSKDWLFNPTYRHKHHPSSGCPECNSGVASICDAALKLSCQELGCNEQELISRVRSKAFSNFPVIHFGLVASGDAVMKSGEDRDKASSRDGVIAFEMEGAGVWETFPSCLVIKGVCDYADSHKNKIFQHFAAATAAATTKSILKYWDPRVSKPSVGTTNTAIEAMNSRIENAHYIRPFLPRQLGSNNTNPSYIDPARRVAVLKALYTSPYRDRKERNPDRVAGTCEWFISHEYYQQWRRHSTSSMLLVSADPGCGKSVLAKYLVDHELSTTESRTTCYFFFKDDFADQRSSRSALSCILHQLFEQKEILLTEKIIERFEVHGEALTGSFVELWDILITSSRDQNAGEIICVLDAFDECEDQGQSELTRYLGNLYSMSNNFNLKFLITTRPYGHIRRGFQPLTIPGLPVIHLKGHIDTEASKISKEIDIYIKARCRIICKSLNLEKSEEALLLQNLLRIPHRTYLWAYLALDLIAKDINIDKTGIVKATSQLPQTVDEAYERILAKSLNVGETKKLLHIILAAARPLTVAEMNIALTIRKNHVSYTDLSLKSEAHFREYIRDLCGLFVTIIDSKIYLLHQTAKEFLAQDTPRRSPRRKRAKSTWKASLCTQESHRILAEICIWHLQFNEFKNNPLKEPEAVSNYLVCYKLLDYSAHNWARHFRASSMIDSAAVESVLKICANDYYCPAWFNIYWTSVHGNFPLGFSTLMIVCYFGIDQGVRILLKTGKFNINAKDLVYRRTALSWASENGFDGVVKLLLNSGGRLSQAITRLPPVDIEAKDVYGRTPLSYAARKGHTVIAKRLVKSKANTRSKDNVGGTPISYALCFGQDELVRVLLRGTPVNSDHNDLELLLSTAIEMDDVPTIMLLLDSGKINPSSGGKEGQPSLLYAVKNGKEDVVKLLLSRSEVAADLGDNNMRTPLSWAVQVGTKAIVKLLLESGKVNPDSKDNHGRTPLSYAAQSGNWKVVMFLIETGKVDVDSKDYHSCTPLSYAVQSSNWTIARFLIGTGKVDVDSKDYHGRTPLSYAAESSYRHIVKLLIESGKVDADSKDNHGRTPLSYAAESRYRHMVKLLIESGKVDADSKDNHGRTPLSYAAELGYRDIASCLIKSGKVDMDSKDKDGRTPLLWAVRSDSRDTAKFLIESGKVDADSKDKDGRTPLSWAVQPGNWHIAEFLIESGKADANSKDNHGRTPLSWAAQFGNRYAIDRLLVSGKVDSRLADNSGQTPEAYATRHNHHDVAKLLREWHDV